MEDWLEEIVESVLAREPPNGMSTRVVAIDGHGGAGKSTLADLISSALRGAPIVHTDDFASWDNPVDWWPRLLEEVLEPLGRGVRTIRYRRSSWGPGHHPTEWCEISAADFVVLEGVTASREAFRPFITYAIWIETPHELRLRRGLERDGPEARGQWLEWMAGEDRYVSRERPQENADIVLPGDQDLWA